VNWADYVIIGIITLSALVSVIRGFVREAISLAGWIIAFWVALTFAEPLGAQLADYVSVPSLRTMAAFFGLLLVSIVLVALVGFLVGQLVDKSGLDGTDRMLGILFGIARGVLLVALLVLLAGLTPLPSDPWWHDSIMIPHMQGLAVWLRGFLPPEIASDIVFG
jgi:membrane protein required for colicin V production